MYDAFDVLRVPFPFSDVPLSKKRPALVLSSKQAFGAASGQLVVAMITSAQHSTFPLDVMIQFPEKAGLPKGCKLRMKLFTLEACLVEKYVGHFHDTDRQAATGALRQLFPFLQGDL